MVRAVRVAVFDGRDGGEQFHDASVEGGDVELAEGVFAEPDGVGEGVDGVVEHDDRRHFAQGRRVVPESASPPCCVAC